MSASRHQRRVAARIARAGLCVPLWACLLISPERAAAQAALEYDVKAAFLLNFTKFIDWPAGVFASPDAPFTICILGKDPFGKALDQTVEGESVNGRKLTVRRISESPEAQGCQVIFVDSGEKDVRRILDSLKSGILTVGEGEGFMRDRGMIAFVIENRRVRFDINQSTAENAGLRLSSKLLSVARSVEK